MYNIAVQCTVSITYITVVRCNACSLWTNNINIRQLVTKKTYEGKKSNAKLLVEQFLFVLARNLFVHAFGEIVGEVIPISN